MKLELTPNGELAWAISTLKSVVGHRLADDESITAVEFADRQTTHPFGRLLKSTNDSDKSLWQVQGDVLTEVHRFNEKTRFVISVTEVAHNVEQKHLPRSFTVTTWDANSGQLKSTCQVYNEWIRVGHLDLPSRLVAATSKDDGSRRVEQIELTEHTLFPAGAEAPSRMGAAR